MLFLGIAGFVGVGNKVEAGGCYTAHSYGAYPGSPCNWWSPWSAFIHSCQENNSYSDCYNWYYNGHYCYGDWYDISCDSSNCGDTVTCPVCGNTVTCPNCGTPTPTGEVKDCGESGCNDAPYPGNRCDGNVCNRISCPDGYKKSGYCDCVPDVTPTPTFTPTPLPLNCGQSGCDGRGCTPSNISCNSNPKLFPTPPLFHPKQITIPFGLSILATSRFLSE